ncbi:MAG: amino acid decarboxylase [Oscillospiraceae bacterium]|nr:amino acid decarboxylase [Oscillospiraceae bacterium]
MNTPIHDFVNRYKDLRPARFHMPGHKGRGPLGCEEWDLTEIPGADSLYEASGVIAESEANASRLFGCPTFYSTEGSSHCIRAMLLLAKQLQTVGGGVPDAPQLLGSDTFGASRTPPPTEIGRRFRVLAARNVHRAFLSAAALLDLDVVWLPQAAGSYLSAAVTPEALDAALAESGAQAVYLTCPDYLGFLPDLRPLARVCHARGALLLVDNAHGAYLRFLSPSRHPMDLGADLCCDSAHKTLPVLTGGAYLHVKGTGNRERGTGDEPGSTARSGAQCAPREPAPDEATAEKAVRDALALFGSSSPSYLILQSLDLANPWLEALPEKLAAFLPRVEALKARLRAAGWKLVGDEPLKLTICCHSQPCPAQSRRGSEESVPSAVGLKGEAGPSAALRSAQDDRIGGGLALAAALEQAGIFCEFADPDYLVLMLSPQNTAEELDRLERALTGREALVAPVIAGGTDAAGTAAEASGDASLSAGPKAVCSLREALLSPCELVPAGESPGRVLARPGVSCPPAVPILMPGERIDEAAAAAFARYGIRTVAVLPRRTTNTDS